MRKIAFLYPGQGSQKIGMGLDLRQTAPDLFARYLTRCDQIMELPITDYCIEGPAETLNQTHIAQPALFAHSLALTDYARQQGLVPDFVAGHSLGEYTAAVVAGVLTFEEGLYLVCRRGRLMYTVQQERPGAMAAVLNMTAKTLQTLLQGNTGEDTVVIANWNTATQLVVSGSEQGIERLIAEIRAKKVGQVIKLPIKGSFHSLAMHSVQQELHAEVSHFCWHNAQIPIAVNVSGDFLQDGEQIQQALLEQITSPVQWMTCIQTLVDNGCRTFVELGSKQVLTKLVRAIAPEVTAYAADTLENVMHVSHLLRDSSNKQ